MQLTDTNTKRAAEDFKALCVEAYQESGMTQEQLADSLRTTQANISRWFSYATDIHLPAFIIPLLPIPIAQSVVRCLAQKVGMHLMPDFKMVDKVDGRLDDEYADIIVRLGKLYEDFKKHPEKKSMLAKDLNECLRTFEQIEHEVR